MEKLSIEELYSLNYLADIRMMKLTRRRRRIWNLIKLCDTIVL
jgi:hypothetical protein